MNKYPLLIIITTLLCCCGCGYTTGSLLPSELETIYIEPFRNKIQLTEELSSEQYRYRSYRAQLEVDVTQAVIENFIIDGNLEVAKRKDADLILSGNLIDFLRQPLRYGADNETVDEYRVSIICSLELMNVQKNELMWEESRVIGDSTYNISGAFSGTEASSVSVAIADIARRIVNRTIEGW